MIGSAKLTERPGISAVAVTPSDHESAPGAADLAQVQTSKHSWIWRADMIDLRLSLTVSAEGGQTEALCWWTVC